MTIGILAITNENHTVINIHEKIIKKILENQSECVFTNLLFDPRTFLGKEVAMIELLLNSNNNKLNKSSSLWHLYKKLFIFSQDQSNEYLQRFVDTALVSAKLHSTNYYAWNFLRWVSNFSRLCEGKKELDSYLSRQVLQFSERNMNDAAAWGCLSSIMITDLEGLGIMKFEVEQISNGVFKWKEISEFIDFLIPINAMYYCERIALELKPVSPVPYIAINELITHIRRVGDIPTIIGFCDMIDQRLSDFDEKLKSRGIKYEIHNGYFTTSVPTENDLIFHQDLQRFINLRQTQQWIKNFVTNDV